MLTVEVGQQIPTLSVEISREQIAEYAEASGDRNPIHLDDDFARSVGLPGLIAHGMLDMGILARMLVDWAGDPGKLERLRCRFAGMVEPGDTLTCQGRIAKVGDDSVELELWAENQRGEHVLSKGYARLKR